MYSTNYIKNLTALRGIAAILTFIFHANIFLGLGVGALIPNKETGIISKLYLMVDFFFILSGFIMMHVYGDWFTNGVSRKTYLNFMKARFARIYPLHIFSLLTIVCILWFSYAILQVPQTPSYEIRCNGNTLLSNIFLLHSMNMHDWFSWVHASWSISTEWWMYILFPFMVNFLTYKSNWSLSITLCIAFVLYVLIGWALKPLVSVPEEIVFLKQASDGKSIDVSYQWGFVRCLAGFLVGTVTFNLYKKKFGINFLSNGYVFLILLSVLLVCMHMRLLDILTISIFPLMILLASYSNPSIDKILQSKPLQKLGDWSFSIYLLHQSILVLFVKIIFYLSPPASPNLTFTPPPIGISWGITLCLGLILVVFSYLSYKYIEVPSRARFNPKFNQTHL